MRTEQSDRTPSHRLRYLTIAGLMLFFGLVIYLILGSMEYAGSSVLLTALYSVLAVGLMLFLLAALFLLACAGSPALGRVVARRAQYLKDAWLVPMRHFGLGGWHIEGASEHHRLASERIRHRHERRRYTRSKHSDTAKGE